MSLKRNNANFEFTIHLDRDKGPNRTTYEPNKAIQFFKKLHKNNPKCETLAAKVKHLSSELVWETDTPDDLAYFCNTFVATVGISANE